MNNLQIDWQTLHLTKHFIMRWNQRLDVESLSYGRLKNLIITKLKGARVLSEAEVLLLRNLVGKAHKITSRDYHLIDDDGIVYVAIYKQKQYVLVTMYEAQYLKNVVRIKS